MVRMTKGFNYKGVDWEVDYGWDDVRSNMYIVSVKVQGSDVDLYNYLHQSVVDGLYDALEASYN